MNQLAWDIENSEPELKNMKIHFNLKGVDQNVGSSIIMLDITIKFQQFSACGFLVACYCFSTAVKLTLNP